MTEYTSMFGVARVIGLGEGRDDRNGAAAVGMSGIVKEMVVPLSLTGPDFNKDKDNDGTFDSFGRGAANIPANATVVSADVVVRSVTGTVTKLNVGTYKKDGTVIDADGLVAATAATKGLLKGAGALVGKNVGADASYIKAEMTGATDIDADIVIKYVL